MKNKELLEKAFAEGRVPYGVTYCFLSECQRKEECVHFLCSLCLKDGKKRGIAVFPAALEGGCEFFAPLRVVRMAWGFNGLFADVRVRDAKLLRDRMKAMLGSHGQYYRYRSGRLRLTPEKQQEVRLLFAEYGYDDVDFDDFSYDVDFTDA